MGSDVTGLHHVGHVVRDMEEALALYRRLGFALPPPAYPAKPTSDGTSFEAFGPANTHADFARDFVELATYVPADGSASVPSDAKLVPLRAPADVLPTIMQKVDRTSATIAACLERFQGLHILMFAAADIDASAARLTASGVSHDGVNAVERPVETAEGTVVEQVQYLEIDDGDPTTQPGAVAEGRIGVVAELDHEIQESRQLDHPNGALGLVETVLCVADDELASIQARYETYLDRRARTEGVTTVVDLDGSRLLLVPHSELGTVLPGETAPALPALVAYTVAVSDAAATEALLRANGFAPAITFAGDSFVPSAQALGAAVVFRE